MSHTSRLRTKLAVALTVWERYIRRGRALITEGAINDVVDDLLNRIVGWPESKAVILEPRFRGPARPMAREVGHRRTPPFTPG